jgi:hypothetical protein
MRLYLSVDEREQKTVLLKILNINLFSLAMIENYEGNTLPDDFDIAKYLKVTFK